MNHLETKAQNPAQRWLVQEYKRRKNNNSQYSLRAFARSLGLPPGRLSEIFSGKRLVTDQLAQKIAVQLGLSPQQKKNLLPPKKISSLTPKPASDYQLLAQDEFEAISEWHHFAFLNLIETTGFKPQVAWIAKKLRISTTETRDMLARLERLGLIRISEDAIMKSKRDFRTSTDIPSAAIRASHRMALNQALEALEELSVEERDITSILFPADPELLDEAKELIRDFRYKMDKFFEKGRCTEVYRLNIQLIPVTKKGEIK